jgi:hypothetical protein
MTIPSPLPSIKASTVALRHVKTVLATATVCAAAWLSAGCAPLVAEAPFPSRPDTVEPGDLLGPFDGRVLDGATGKPVSGAIVWASWGFEVGRGLSAPAGAVTASVETDSDGRYLIPRLAETPDDQRRVARFTLVVYKRGYIAYRSDRRFEDVSPRRDFSQRMNLVKLERFPVGASHVRHVRFVGGAGPLKVALAPEVMQASLELTEAAALAREGTREPGGAEEAPRPLLDASPLLSVEELRAATGYTGALEVDRLADLPRSPTYDSKHFRATGKPESFDAAIRVWKLPTAKMAESRYTRLVAELPGAEVRDELGDRSVRAKEGRLLGVAVLDRERAAVVQLSCGADLCRDHEQAVALLRRILPRVDRLGLSSEPATRDESEESPPAEKPEAPSKDDQQFRLRPPELRR